MESVERGLVDDPLWLTDRIADWGGDCVRTYGVVMMISASTSSLSNFESSPSLSEVVTRVCPWSSSHLRIPSSFSVVPKSSGTSSACCLPS